jgi:hypothetical protein
MHLTDPELTLSRLFDKPLALANPAVRFRLTAALISVTALLLLALQVGNPLPALWEIAPTYLSGIALPPLWLFAAHLCFVRIRAMLNAERRQEWQQNQSYRGYLRAINAVDIVTAFLALALTISCFTIYKSEVIGAAGYHYDATIIALDRLILFGHDGWQLTHGLLPQAEVTKLIDFLYHPAFLPMLLGYVACACAKARPELRYTYINAYLASFVLIGMVFAHLFSSAGPVYDGMLYGDGQSFAALRDTLHQQAVEAGPFYSQMGQGYLFNAYQTHHVRLGSGISAMPSMHIVMVFLWVFAAWSIDRITGVLVTIYGLVIWFGSVHLGWHYFSDGLVGLAMLSVIWWAVARMMRPVPTLSED